MATNTWLGEPGTFSGFWTDAAAWTLGVVPNSSVDVLVNSGTVTQITATATTIAANSLTIDPFGTGVQLNFTSTTLAVGSAIVLGAGTASVDLTLNQGGITAQSITIGAGSSNDRLSVSSGTLSAGSLELDSGTLSLSGGIVAGGAITLNGGSIVSGSGAALSASNFGTLSGVTLTAEGASQTVSGTFYVTGSLTLGGTLDLPGDTIEFLNAETLNDATLLLAGAVEFNVDSTLTLGAGLALDGPGGEITFENGTGTIGVYANENQGTVVNDGIINAAAGAEIYVASFVNNGSLSLGAAGALFEQGTTLTNAGTLSVLSGGTLEDSTFSGPVNFTNSGLLQVDGATSALDLFSSATLTVDNTGTILLTDGGSIEADFAAIDGGTIEDNGGGGLAFDGTLSGVTVLGNVTFALDSFVIAGSGASFAALVAGQTETLTLTGADLVFAQDTTLSATTVIGSVSSLGALDLAASTTVVNGGATAAGVLTNAGVIDDKTASQVQLSGSSFVNTGTVTTVTGDSIDVQDASFTNTGVFQLAAGADLSLRSATAGAALSIENQGGTISVGTLNASGATIDVKPASVLNGGTVTDLHDGTVIADGGSLAIASFGTLDGVSWDGALDLDNNTEVTIENGLTLAGQTGSGPGTLSLAGADSSLYFASSTTLDQVAITVGANIASPGTDSLSGLASDSAALTFGTEATVDVTGDEASTGILSGASVTNHGTLVFGDASSYQVLEGTTIANDRSIVVTAPQVAPEATSAQAAQISVNVSPNFFFDFALLGTDNPGSLYLAPIGEPSQQAIDYGIQLISTPPPPTLSLQAASDPTTTSPLTPVQLAASFQSDETTLAGTGSIVIESGAWGVLNSQIAATQTITFAGAGGALTLLQPQSVRGQITGLTAGDIVDLPTDTFAAGTPADNNGTLLVPGAIAGVDLDLSFAFGFTAADISVVEDGIGGTAIVVACFASGTRIATEAGEMEVERLAVGDRVRTAAGGVRPVRWIGHRRLDLRLHPRTETMRPVRIVSGAFESGLPRRDLTLSPDHAVFVDGALIPVRLLVNRTSIRPLCVDAVDYWHVELDRHDILLAEGLPCESYLDTGNKASFANGPVVEAHSVFRMFERAGGACLPLVTSEKMLEKIRAELMARAEGVTGAA